MVLSAQGILEAGLCLCFISKVVSTVDTYYKFLSYIFTQKIWKIIVVAHIFIHLLSIFPEDISKNGNFSSEFKMFKHFYVSYYMSTN